MLASLLGKGVDVRLLLCEGQQSLGHPTWQAIWQLQGVVGAECLQVRIYRPEAGALPTLHSKMRCSDGEVYYGGSFNFSRNALILEEHLVVVRKPEAVRAHEGWFLGLWEQADGRAGEEELREHEGRFREFWNRTDVQIMGALPAVSESPLASPGRSSGAPSESIS